MTYPGVDLSLVSTDLSSDVVLKNRGHGGVLLILDT
jgi:hypothetical protein